MDLIFECPRKFQLLKEEGLSSEGDSISTSFGTAWHAIKKLRSLGQDIESAWVEGAKGLVSDPAEYRTAEKLLKAEEHYTQRYGGPIIPIHDKAVELETTLWVDGVPIPIKTITDCIAKMDVNEGTGIEKWIVDYKTTSRLEGNWVQQYRVSNQFKAYFAAGKIEHPDAVGVIVDLFHVTKGLKSERGQKGKSGYEIDGVHFYRLPIRYTDFALEEWKKNAAMAYKLATFYRMSKFYPQNAPTACKAYGQSCQFLDICDTQDAEKRELVKLTFKQREDAQEPQGQAEVSQ